MDDAITRKLTTILAADVEGYSRLMAADEVAALKALRDCRAVFGRLIERHGGRIANTAGDGLLADFPSVVEAVLCEVEVQRELAPQSSAQQTAMRFRIGIHLGDVMVDGGDLLGEGVNLAARLQALAEPGGILVSEPVYQQVRRKVSIGFDYRGERRPKNFPEDVPIYGVLLDGQPAPETQPPARPAPQQSPPSDTAPAGASVARRAAQYGVIALGLLAIDLGTGTGWWVQWPALGMAMAFGLEAAPRLARDWITAQLLRAAVVGLGLLAINALTWSGYPWALWPAGGIVVLVLLRALSRSRDPATPA
jgi:adenylate cyclase